MADDYLFYDEDYEDISDWDEGSDSNDKAKDDNTNNIVAKQNKISEQKVDPEPDEEKMAPQTIKNGTTEPLSTPNKTVLTTSNNANDVMVMSRSPTALSIPYIPKSTASSFILHKYSVFTSKVMYVYMDDVYKYNIK